MNEIKGIVSGNEVDISKVAMIVNGVDKGWEVRTQNGDILWGADRTLTGTDTIQMKGYGLPLKSVHVEGNGRQQGTPTPDAPIMPEFVGVKTANLWDKGVPIYAYATDYKKYNPNNAIALKAGTYTFSSDGILPQIQVFHADLSPYTDIQDVIQNDSALYVAWDNRALLPVGNTFRRTTIVIVEDCIITICCNSAYIGTYIMLNTGSTALPFEPFGYKIPITCGGTTTPIYLGQTQTVRQIKKQVLTGDEKYTLQSINAYGIANFYFYLGTNIQTVICTHFKKQITIISQTTDEGYLITPSGPGQNATFYMRIDSATASTAAELKAYLAAQYAAGTPVTVWYVLAEPETATSNEPIAKIGDYADTITVTADDVQITPAVGNDTLTVDTTIPPSAVTVVGHVKSRSVMTLTQEG